MMMMDSSPTNHFSVEFNTRYDTKCTPAGSYVLMLAQTHSHILYLSSSMFNEQTTPSIPSPLLLLNLAPTKWRAILWGGIFGAAPHLQRKIEILASCGRLCGAAIAVRHCITISQSTHSMCVWFKAKKPRIIRLVKVSYFEAWALIHFHSASLLFPSLKPTGGGRECVCQWDLVCLFAAELFTEWISHGPWRRR